MIDLVGFFESVYPYIPKVPHDILFYTLYYFVGPHLASKGMDYLFHGVKERLWKKNPSIFEGKMELYMSLCSDLIEKLEDPPGNNPFNTKNFDVPHIKRIISFLPELVNKIRQEKKEYKDLNPETCLTLIFEIYNEHWNNTTEEDRNKLKEALSSSKELQKTLTVAHEEIMKKLRELEDLSFLPPRITYENYFGAVERRRKEELEKLGLYVPLGAREMEIIETKLAPPGEKPEWATEAIKRCIENKENAVIWGESGSGKTFTFLNLFKGFKEKFNEDASYIPLFVELYRLKDHNLGELLNGAYLNAKIGDTRFERDRAKYIVFLDGLNEAPDPEQAFIDIKTLGLRYFISTQRVYEYVGNEFKTVFQIQDLEPQQVIEYLRHFIPSHDEAKEFYDGLDESLKEQVQRPVILFFLTTLYKETGRIPHNLGELLTRFADFICERRLEKGVRVAQPISPRYKEEILPLIAFRMCEEGERSISRVKMQEIIEKEYGGRVDFYDFEVEASQRYWLLNEVGEGEIAYEFTREALRNYFAAEYVKKHISTKELLSTVFPEGYDREANPIFSSISEILCGIVPEEKAVEIIRAILPKDTYLTASCFARSSIATRQEDLLRVIDGKISLYDREYFLFINRVVQFHKKGVELYRSNDMANDPDYALCQMHLGLALGYKLDYDGAIEAYRKALLVYEANNMANHPSYALCQMNLGIVLSYKLDYDGAIEAFRKALCIYEANNMANHPSYAHCQIALGNALRYKLDHDGAIEAFRKALCIYEANDMANDPDYALCQMHLGLALSDKLDYDGAIEAYRKALLVLEANKIANHPDYADCQMNLGLALGYKLDYDGAIEAFRKALCIYEANNMANHPSYALCQEDMGFAYYNMGNLKEAAGHLQQAREIFEYNIRLGRMPRGHPWYKKCLEWIKKVEGER